MPALKNFQEQTLLATLFCIVIALRLLMGQFSLEPEILFLKVCY